MHLGRVYVEPLAKSLTIFSPLPSPGTRLTLNIMSFHKAITSVSLSTVISSPTAFSVSLTLHALNTCPSGAVKSHSGRVYVEPLAKSLTIFSPLPSPGTRLTLYFTFPLLTIKVYTLVLVPSCEVTVILKVFSSSFNLIFSVSYPLGIYALLEATTLLFNVTEILCLLSPNWKYK